MYLRSADSHSHDLVGSEFHIHFYNRSGPTRLMVKDAIMMGAALVTMADSARAYLRKRTLSQPISENEVRPTTPAV